MVKHFVSYHNDNKMPYPAEKADRYSVGTKKKLDGSFVGNVVWSVSGKKESGDHHKYLLRSRWMVRSAGQSTQPLFGYVASGDDEHGQSFDPPILLNDQPWFPEFLRSQSNFSLGLQPIRDEFVAHLEAMSTARVTGRNGILATTSWGTELESGSGSIDLVLLAATRPMRAREIEAEVDRLGMPRRESASPHLSSLKRRKLVHNEAGHWYRLPRPRIPGAIDKEQGAVEGAELFRLHRLRERNRALINRKKAQVLKSKKCLACEACGFDFLVEYGPRGDGFAECHHTQPLGDGQGVRQTLLEHLAIFCSNCHRMLHRRPFLDVPDLAALVAKRRRGRRASR